ncbi:hypothetical protein EUTSA_v10026311mg [Eutrema salsugineum]|uniref:OVATE domain-containing protein n=1 Tax=Eutrema salsugineum TaxID=72664 RepID=V4MIE2_EUTSA|nr:uncharacterized protein LOC18030312 [Eutrema salsugineum]ESQ56394.1 hypothetical protein EUTSA_v10026311mg [Eutrema salsugineum]
MALRSSISNTRKFFQKTIDNFKSFFSNNGTYHKLPKTPNNTSTNNPHHHYPNPNIITSSSSSIQKQFQPKARDYVTKNRALTQPPRRGDRDETLFSKPKVEIVRRRLEEMEKMMNDDIINDEEHVSDVREFLHCYSRLRCAAYLDVVEQFFMEVYSDFFSTQPLEHARAAVQSLHPTVFGVRSYGGGWSETLM